MLFLIALAVGREGVSQAAPDAAKLSLNRKIELMVRSKYELPPGYDVTLGARTPGSIPGYDALVVTLSKGPKSMDVKFLISTDNKKLARMETFDLDANPVLSIDVAGRPVRGNPNAPVTVINFDDLECPACARMHGALFPAALDRYKDKVRFVYRDNPLEEIHPWAVHASVNANCLAAQSGSAYWNYVDYVHTHGQEVTGETRELQKSFAALDRIAIQETVKAGLDPNTVQVCINKQDEAPVRKSMKEAEGLGLNMTPVLFVNGEEVRGLGSEEDLWKVIDRALKEAGVEPPKTTAAN